MDETQGVRLDAGETGEGDEDGEGSFMGGSRRRLVHRAGDLLQEYLYTALSQRVTERKPAFSTLLPAAALRAAAVQRMKAPAVPLWTLRNQREKNE